MEHLQGLKAHLIPLSQTYLRQPQITFTLYVVAYDAGTHTPLVSTRQETGALGRASWWRQAELGELHLLSPLLKV